MKTTFLFILLTIYSFSSCKIMQMPLGSLNEYNFIIYPRVVNKEGGYYLQYQFSDTMKNGSRILLTGVTSKIKNKKCYYYFDVAVSFFDNGEMHEIKINDTVISQIGIDAIYWLNSDNTEIKLEILH